MEVAGIVLGAIPIALYVLDQYRRCLRAGKDIVKYRPVINTLLNHIFVQKRQLVLTLQNLGLHITDGQLPTKNKLEHHLSTSYPAEDCERFMGIIVDMEETMGQLLHKLDVDLKGKPCWDKGAQDRMTWEWRRVRRSCGSSAREKLIGELQYWNTALAKVFEKPEIPHGGDSDGILVQRLQVQFSSKTCNDVRSTLHQTYDAFTQTWQCDCPEHSGSLLLTWHKEESHVPTKAKLELPLLNGSWACLTIQPPKEQNNIPDTFLQRDGVVESAQTNQDSTKKTGGIPWKIKQKLKSIKLLESETIPIPSTAIPLAPAPTVSSSAALPQISCMCEFLRQNIQQPREAQIQSADQYSERKTQLMLTCMGVSPPHRPRPSQVSASITRTPTKGGPKPIPRKDRFAIAAAATWAVLYLCDTPWLADDWAGLCTLLMAVSAETPAISCILKPNPNSTNPAPRPPPQTYHDGIRNRVLFSLGVLLIELCLNTTMDAFRSTNAEYSALTDYELADRLSDSIYDDAGRSFGYAVQRCLRCEFPGHDSLKRLENEQFRKIFFDGVVAPVQVAYELQCT